MMLFLICEIMICLIIAFILGLIIGWLLKSIFCKEKAAVPATPSTKPARSNDLQKVEGIGPKIASLFIKNGILDLDDLSKTPVSTLEKILEDAGPRYQLADPETWPEQAALGARGDWDAMEELKEQLRGGRRV